MQARFHPLFKALNESNYPLSDWRDRYTRQQRTSHNRQSVYLIIANHRLMMKTLKSKLHNT